MQNTLARVVLGSSAAKFSHSIDMLRYLHWLPVEYGIKFKLAKLAFNTRNNSAPLYLTCLVHDYVPGRSLRSNQSNLLPVTVPSCKLNFGTRSFRVAAPTIWNSLPADIRACSLYSSFTRHLKTFNFNTAFNEWLLLGQVTARASDSMFLFIDFVRVTNCFLRLRLRLRSILFIHTRSWNCGLNWAS